jgi:hypothetical protein
VGDVLGGTLNAENISGVSLPVVNREDLEGEGEEREARGVAEESPDGGAEPGLS